MANIELAKKYADAIKAADVALHHLGESRTILGGVSDTLDRDLYGIAEAIMRAQRTMADNFRYIEETVKRDLLGSVLSALREKRVPADAFASQDAHDYLYLQSIKQTATE